MEWNQLLDQYGPADATLRDALKRITVTRGRRKGRIKLSKPKAEPKVVGAWAACASIVCWRYCGVGTVLGLSSEERQAYEDAEAWMEDRYQLGQWAALALLQGYMEFSIDTDRMQAHFETRLQAARGES